MWHIDPDAIERVRKLKDRAKVEDKEHYINVFYYHPEFFPDEEKTTLKSLLGYPGHDEYEHTLCPSYKRSLKKGASSTQHEFEDICEFGIEGLSLCYCFDEVHADLYMCEEEMRSLCRKCDHYTGRGFDSWVLQSIYNPKIVYEKYKHYIERKNPEAYVYFITDGHYIKIGKAQDPLKRLCGIQTGNPNKCELLYLIPVKCSSWASELESYLHGKYSQYQKCGEWFDLMEKLEHEKWARAFPPCYEKKREVT